MQSHRVSPCSTSLAPVFVWTLSRDNVHCSQRPAGHQLYRLQEVNPTCISQSPRDCTALVRQARSTASAAIGDAYVPLPNATVGAREARKCRKRSILHRLLVAAALLLVISGGSAMGLFTSLVLFSPVSGVVLKDGAPVEEAEIRQELRLFDEKLPVQRALSDSSGRFHFAIVERRAGLSRIVPHEPVITQTIIITYAGKEYEAWIHTKNSYELNSELDGHPLRLQCELSREPDFEGKHYGICKAV